MADSGLKDTIARLPMPCEAGGIRILIAQHERRSLVPAIKVLESAKSGIEKESMPRRPCEKNGSLQKELSGRNLLLMLMMLAEALVISFNSLK